MKKLQDCVKICKISGKSCIVNCKKCKNGQLRLKITKTLVRAIIRIEKISKKCQNGIGGSKMNKKTRNLINLGALKCCICGLAITNADELSKEHEPPLSRGGSRDNWKYAHKKCNHDKGALTLEEYRLFCELRKKRNGNVR